LGRQLVPDVDSPLPQRGDSYRLAVMKDRGDGVQAVDTPTRRDHSSVQRWGAADKIGAHEFGAEEFCKRTHKKRRPASSNS
jgi:hypothetical protein